MKLSVGNLLKNIADYHIILASNSPRRKELLAGLGMPFEIRVLDNVDESYPPTLAVSEVALFISKTKAAAYVSTLKNDELIITADTVVLLNNEILGKPINKEEAILMLKKLSGNKHEVITGVSLTSTKKNVSFSVSSFVQFAALSDYEISLYVEQFNPLDKAGAYGIQEWIGYIGVENIEGSFYNVMGLPIQRLYKELKNF